MNLQGRLVALRALEPEDVELLYGWENDPAVWGISGTTAPFSRAVLQRFIEQQQYDIYRNRQLRLVIECATEAVGAIDLFEFDPQHLRAGVGILIHDVRHRGQGYAADALEVLEEYCRRTLRLHQLWCNVASDNAASLALFRGAGYARIGTKREWIRTERSFVDEVMMQKILQ